MKGEGTGCACVCMCVEGLLGRGGWGGVIRRECCLSQKRHNGDFNLKMMQKLLRKNLLLKWKCKRKIGFQVFIFNQNTVNVLNGPSHAYSSHPGIMFRVEKVTCYGPKSHQLSSKRLPVFHLGLYSVIRERLGEINSVLSVCLQCCEMIIFVLQWLESI